jgi:uncharacterized protein (TIGR02594 family)
VKAYELAKAEVGTVEWAEGSNPKVVAYYRDAGHPEVKDDAVAWCAAFVGAMLKRAGMPNTGLLTARSYLKWGDGVNLDQAKPGDIVIFKRGNSTWEGHVAFFVRNAGTHLEVLGGNQRDAVNISRYPVSQLLGIRRMAAAPASKPQGAPKAPAAPSAPANPTSLLARFLAALVAFFTRKEK